MQQANDEKPAADAGPVDLVLGGGPRVNIQFRLYDEQKPVAKHYSSEYGGLWSSDWCVCILHNGTCKTDQFTVGRTEKEAQDDGRMVYSSWEKPGWPPKYVAWAYVSDVLAALSNEPPNVVVTGRRAQV